MVSNVTCDILWATVRRALSRKYISSQGLEFHQTNFPLPGCQYTSCWFFDEVLVLAVCTLALHWQVILDSKQYFGENLNALQFWAPISCLELPAAKRVEWRFCILLLLWRLTTSGLSIVLPRVLIRSKGLLSPGPWQVLTGRGSYTVNRVKGAECVL